jgi:hypothetical protein
MSDYRITNSAELSQSRFSSRLTAEQFGGTMSDMPIWFRMAIYVTVAATVLYAAWGFIHSMM